ncbi:unnamed protein product [Didymodactylos carnosus]|uniref:Uncharacterized protein n=1 Tax=Didymodactylos carnosus TaxID=1234261 RepID=A0A814I120_9BILA|nr:unnamed protein product [Didymodactylos carnosus]CAF3788271.1 unnamed protein product [Didymodactylos carnosus]
MPVSPSFYSDGVPPNILGLAEQAARNTGGAYRNRGRQSRHNPYQGPLPDDRRCGNRAFTSSSRPRLEGMRPPDRLVSQGYRIANEGNQHHYTYHRHTRPAGYQETLGDKRPASITPPAIKVGKFLLSEKVDACAGVKQTTAPLTKPTTTQSSITIPKLSTPQLSDSTKRRLRRERAQAAAYQQQSQSTGLHPREQRRIESEGDGNADEPIITKIVVASISRQGNDTDKASSDDEVFPDRQPQQLVVKMTSMTVHDGDDDVTITNSGDTAVSHIPPAETVAVRVA